MSLSAASVGKDTKWLLRQSKIGVGPNSQTASRNIQDVGRAPLESGTQEVIGLLGRPQLAEDERINAVPTRIRKLPEPLAGLTDWRRRLGLLAG